MVYQSSGESCSPLCPPSCHPHWHWHWHAGSTFDSEDLSYFPKSDKSPVSLAGYSLSDAQQPHLSPFEFACAFVFRCFVMFFCTFWLLAVFLALASGRALGIPSWDGGFGTRPQVAIGTLVPGSTAIEAVEAGISTEKYRPKYLSVTAPRGKHLIKNKTQIMIENNGMIRLGCRCAQSRSNPRRPLAAAPLH